MKVYFILDGIAQKNGVFNLKIDVLKNCTFVL